MPDPTDDRSRQLQSEMGLMSEEDLALLIGVKLDTLQVWRSEGAGPAYCKLGRAVFYRRADVHNWIQSSIVPVHTPKRMAS